MAAVHVHDDGDVDIVSGAAYGVELREACGVGRAGASDDDGVGVVEPAGQPHPPQVTGYVGGDVAGCFDVDEQALGGVIADERRDVADALPARIDTVSMQPPRSRPDTCTSQALGSSRRQVPGVSRVYSPVVGSSCRRSKLLRRW